MGTLESREKRTKQLLGNQAEAILASTSIIADRVANTRSCQPGAPGFEPVCHHQRGTSTAHADDDRSYALHVTLQLHGAKLLDGQTYQGGSESKTVYE